MSPQNPRGPRIVLVHGGFVDGSGWAGVQDLKRAGHDVTVVGTPRSGRRRGGDPAGDRGAGRPGASRRHSYGGR
jgi:hypothetical protein